MIEEKKQHRVLVVSASDKLPEFLAELLPQNEFFPVLRVRSAGEARQQLSSAGIDLLIINTPLPDDFGVQLALDFYDRNMGILLLIKADIFEQITYRVERFGIFPLAKPNTRQAFSGAIHLLTAFLARLSVMEQKTQTLEEKMQEIRLINHAKWLLIDHMNMKEDEAHHYLEKQSMDLRLSRREVAEMIIRTYQ